MASELTWYRIPLAPPQKLFVSINNVTYRLTVRWCAAEEGGWLLDIADSGSNYLVQGIMMVTGTDLLRHYKYLNIGAYLVLLSEGSDPTLMPTYETLGVSTNLFYGV